MEQKIYDIQESGEDYLEKIMMLHEKREVVKSIDLANAFGYSRPAISKAVKILKQDGYLIVEKNGNLLLTEKGVSKAQLVLKRHRILTEFFTILNVPLNIAEHDACKIEHDIHPETFKALEELLIQLKNKS